MSLSGSMISRYLEYPRFRNQGLSVVLLDTGYLTVAECRRGLEKLGHTVHTLAPGKDFIKRLLTLLVQVKPDFLLTVNHLGFDEEGILTGMLTELKIPFASWYVDSPSYVLKNGSTNVSEYCTVFCWERTYLQRLSAMGFEEPRFLPLGTDPDIFHPSRGGASPSFRSSLGFVADSLTTAVAKWDRIVGTGILDRLAEPVIERQLQDRTRPMAEIVATIADSSPVASMIDLEAALVWRATREYRLRLVKALLPLGMVIYGDNGWKVLLGKKSPLKGGLHYYRELPRVYCQTRVNFNATSLQMNSAVNQRVFDCAACGAFLLSDRMADMERFFEPGRESICYNGSEEAVSLASYYLDHETERQAIADAARRRVLAEHTYEHRMASLVQCLREKHA